MIEMLDLTKKFGNLVAVDSLNLKVEQGEIFGLLGPNGCGKTTTIRMLCGLLIPTSGSAIVSDYKIFVDHDKIREIIGYMPQFHGLYENLTLMENLKFYAEIYQMPKEEVEERIYKLLDMVQLREKENDLVRNFSQGHKQMASLVRALLHDPKILFLDEPTAGVDPELRQEFWKFFHKLKNRGVTMLVPTHYMDEADQCDRISIMNYGKLIGVETPKGFRRLAAERGIETDSMEEIFIQLTKGEVK